ncbi:hypothetical protein HERIO_1502 [Hepatospora eriocheir]|uniref:C2H2-type domain-containing protein n=1 Tax=Hepatospora eriocheir TaxID=1081669 RepID=A0A1X0QA73_9MICR|nr:hypothetical protein HERIO_1502 [Hepatospora eriocheir]
MISFEGLEKRRLNEGQKDVVSENISEIPFTNLLTYNEFLRFNEMDSKERSITRTEYNNYVTNFLLENLYKVYSNNEKFTWFIDRYIKGIFKLKNEELKEKSNIFCLPHLTNEEYDKYLSKGYMIFFNYFNNDLVIEKDAYFYSTESSIRTTTKISMNEYQEYYFLSVYWLKRLYNSLCKLYGGNERNDLPDDDKELTKMLRNDFYFCTTCCIKYDQKIFMDDFCSRHFPGNFNFRRIYLICEIANVNKIDLFDYMKIEDLVIKRYVNKAELECRECFKKFINFDMITEHIKSKHLNIREEIECEYQKWNNFIENMDLTILYAPCKLNNKYMHPLLKKSREVNPINYKDLTSKNQ